MKSGLEIFEFKEEDEIPELVAGRILDKIRNPSLDNHATLKYELLECVAEGSDVPQKGICTMPCIDIDAMECDNGSVADVGNSPLGMVKANTEANSCLDTALQLSSPNHEQDSYPMIPNHDSGSSHTEHDGRDSSNEAPSPGERQTNYVLADASSCSVRADVKSNDDESMKETFPSNCAVNIAEGNALLDDHTSDACFSNYSEMDDVDIAVDYVVYRDYYCTGCNITFSNSGIRISGSTAYGNQYIFKFERGIDDIIHIKSQHLQQFGTIYVRLHVLSKEAVQADNEHKSSGVEELRFVAIVPNWSEIWEEITSLNDRYLLLWTNAHDDDGIELEQRRPYFPNFDVAFEDVIYPKGDSDAVSISKRDVDLLQPETFINDTIIDFYIKYLKNQIPPNGKNRFHFFNSFFFRKLADMDKDPSSASDGRAAFLRVQKWTRKVEIFGKDYIFIPVNFNLHWSLLVICHPGEVASFKDEDARNLPKLPCILHMDSIKGTHTGLKNLVQSYLWEEWKARQKDATEDLSSKFLNLRFVSLELPQQENSFDCGLFLLHYLELFLVDAPVNFSPFKINDFSKFLHVDWFPPAEASLKRTLIQRLISELLESHSREVSSDDRSDEPQSNCPESMKGKTIVEFVSERCSTTVGCHGNLPRSEAGQGIEITLLEASSLRNPQCINDQGLVLREFLDQGVTAGSLLAQCAPFDQPSSFYRLNGTMSQIEQDDAGTVEYYPAGESVFHQMADIATSGSMAYYGGWNPGLSMQGEEDESSAETSTCDSDDSDVGIIENPQIQDIACGKEQINEQTSSSMENRGHLMGSFTLASGEMLETSASEGGKDLNTMYNENEHANGCHEENATTSLHEDLTGIVQNGLPQDLEKTEATCDDVETVGDDHQVADSGSDEKQAAKRRKLTPPPIEGEACLTERLTHDDIQF